ncbi:hypothetical protein D1BOALGB6SA_2626 [Olavius sp. associated proteobacterium Delta 1]|nr:hypothetical protein D1BOALGB6SA_2626 [Olavius sp. associated proteobacterium Delta 1]
MNFNRLGIISLIAAVVFVLPLFAAAQDVVLRSDGKVRGRPFKVLQQQIDDLQQQINAIQDNS